MTVEVDDPATLTTALNSIMQKHRTIEGLIVDGGATIERINLSSVVISSSGEDALDSLSYCINITLGNALTHAGARNSPRVTDEQRTRRQR